MLQYSKSNGQAMNSIGQLRSNQQINFNIFLNSNFVVVSCTSTGIVLRLTGLEGKNFLHRLDGIRYENIRDT